MIFFVIDWRFLWQLMRINRFSSDELVELLAALNADDVINTHELVAVKPFRWTCEEAGGETRLFLLCPCGSLGFCFPQSELLCSLGRDCGKLMEVSLVTLCDPVELYVNLSDGFAGLRVIVSPPAGVGGAAQWRFLCCRWKLLTQGNREAVCEVTSRSALLVEDADTSTEETHRASCSLLTSACFK